MLFENLKLKNFKSHVNSSIDFHKGVTLVIGENGAGKSSIFEAITFALFKKYTVKNLNDLVRTDKNMGDKTTMEVQLTFTSGVGKYRITRSAVRNNRNPSSNPKPGAELVQIYESGREDIIASGVREVDSEIEKILSMDATTFLNAIHIRQGEISKLVDDKPAERKKLIGKLLKLDDLEKAYSQMPLLIKDVISDRSRYEGKIQNEDELEEQMKSLNTDRETFTTVVSKLTEKIEAAQKQLDEKTKTKEELDAKKLKLDKLNDSVKHENENLTLLTSQGEDLNKKYNEILEAEKEMEVLKPFCDKLQVFKQFKEILLKFRQFKKDEAAKNEVISKINENKEIIANESENFEKYNQLDEQIKESEVQQGSLASEVGFITEHEKNKIKFTNSIEEYNAALDAFFKKACEVLKDFDADLEIEDIKSAENLDILKQSIENLIASTKAEIKKAEDELKGFNDESIVLSHEIKNSKKPLSEIKKVDNKCPTCQSDISEAKKLELIREYEGVISLNSKRIEEIRGLSDEMTSNKESLDKNLKDLESINDFNQYARIIEDIISTTGELAEVDKKIAEGQSKKEELEKLSASIDEMKQNKEQLETSFKNYNDAQGFINSQVDLEVIQKELDTILADISQAQGQMDNLIKEDSDLSVDIDENDLNAKIKDLDAKFARYNQLAGLISSKADYEEQIRSNQESVKKKTEEIETITQKIESCDFDEQVHTELIKSVEELTGEIKQSNDNFISINKDLENTLEKIAELEKTIEQNSKYLKEYDAISDYIKLLEDLRNFYSKDGVQKELRSQSRPLIQKYTKEFFERFNFNYSNLILTDEYDISIFGDDGEVKLDMVSGGEKIAIALSLRLAITQAMSKGEIETILLDEPTIHLDSYRRQELINVLRSMSSIPQMIIVTHDYELETAAQRLIKIKKEDGISKVDSAKSSN